MPVAPRLLEDQQVLDDTGRRLAAVDTADAHGAVIGQALERFGDTAFQLAVGFAERDAERDAQEGDAEFQRRSREIMYGRQPKDGDPEDQGRRGYLSMEGDDATSNRLQTEDELYKLREEIAGRRRSRRAEEAFRSVADRRLESTLEDADRHVLAQQRILEDGAREALATESRNSAISAYLNEDEAERNIVAGVNVVTQQAQADGVSPERTRQMEQAYASSAWAAIIIRRADQDPAGAQAIFDRRRGEMNAEDAARVEEATRAVRLADQARTSVDALIREANGDYTLAMDRAEGIPNTALRDEVITRIIQLGTARETAEARLTDDVEERARAAIHAAGFGAVPGADRARLQREGRWNGLVAEFEARAGGNSEATRRQAQNMADTLLLMSDENAPQFHVVLDAMRGIRTPGVTDEMISAASGGMSREELVDMRNRIVGVNADAMRNLVRRQQEMRSQVPMGQGNDTIVIRIANRLMELGEPMAAARGMDVRRPSLAQQLTGAGDRQNTRNAEWRGFMMEEARRFVAENQGKEPTQQEMEGIIGRALMRSGRNRDGAFAFEARRPAGAFNDRRVSIPFADLDEETQRALHQAYRRENNNLQPLRFDQVPTGAQRQYAEMWREQNPDVEVTPGSAAERELEEFVRRMYTDDPRRTSQLRDRREWMERRYAERLQEY